MKKLFGMTMLLLVTVNAWAWDSSILYPDQNGRLVYESDEKGNRLVDFSHAGYHSGEQTIPNLPVVHTISPVAGDNTAHIQAAINAVAAMTPDANGHRGAILLTKGIYEVSGIIYINQSGIVLRGEGSGTSVNDTQVIGTGTQQKKEQGIILIQGAGGNEVQAGTTQNVLSEFLPMGSRTIEVENGAAYSIGDYLVIRHDPTEAWLEAINYGNVDGDENVWVAGQNDLKMYFHGTVTAVSGNKVKLDTPLYHPLDRSLSQSIVYRHSKAGLIYECGVENMRVISENAGGTDESHRWDCVHFINARNCWAKDSISEGFAESGFRFTKSTRSTVLRCQAINPVSQITGGRRYNFYVGEHSHDVLFKECLATKGRHCFVGNGAASVSGAVFTQCESRNTYSSSENHRRWGSGFLWDNIEWNTASASTVLALHNRGNSGTSHGWTGTGLVAWNIDAVGKYVMCSEPPVGQNYAIGCRANLISGYYPFGFKEGAGQTPSLPSLYEAQLSERLIHGVGPDAPARLEVSHYVNSASPFVAMHWDDIALDETAYVIERSANGGTSFSDIASLPADTVSYTDSTVSQNGTYVYRVKAVNTVGSSAYGNRASVDLASEEWPEAVTYQAEDYVAQSGASMRWDRHGFTGYGYVDINGPTTWFELEIDGGMGGSTPIVFRYGGGETYERHCEISVNGTPVAIGSFATPGSWDAWDTETVMVQLERGMNTVRVRPNGSANGPNFDKLEVHATPVHYAAGEMDYNPASYAFDGNPDTVWKHASPMGSWIQSAQAAPLEVIEYTLMSGDGAAANDPRDWKLMGSNDGGDTWVTVDTRTGILFSSRKQQLTFTVSSSANYDVYRLDVSAVRDGSSAAFVQLAELGFVYATLPPLSPNPAQFTQEPAAASESSITMTAVEGISILGQVEYYFAETSGNAGGSDSGWISSPTYTDTGLNNNYTYSYTVMMRDMPGNETATSAVKSAKPYKMSTIVWNGVGSSDGQWTTGANWTGGGVAPLYPEQYKKVVFNVPSAKECVLGFSATVGQLVIGDNGRSAGIRLVDGAHLLAGYKPGASPVWAAVGYNRSTKLTVETGAVFETAAHLLVGRFETQSSSLEILGGVVDVSTTITLGNDTSAAYGNIILASGGRLECSGLTFNNSNSKIDIQSGMLVLDNDQVGSVNSLISGGYIVNTSSSGSLRVDYDSVIPGKTSVTAMSTIPNVEGQSQSLAESLLIDAGLDIGEITTLSSDAVPAGNVISTAPSGGAAVETGSSVDMVISLGPMVAESATRWRANVSDDWNVGSNWSEGNAPLGKAEHLKTVFDGSTLTPAILDSEATVSHLVVGDNGPHEVNTLKLTNGADLVAGLRPDNTTVWTGIGYNRPALVLVESGAKLTASSHLWIGHNAPSVATLVVDGGYVEVKGTLGAGYLGGEGHLEIRNGGLLSAAGFHSTQSISSNSTVNIASGKLILSGDHVSIVNAYVAEGRITAYSGFSTLLISYDAIENVTTISSVPFGFDSWTGDWGQQIGAATDDPDGDGVNNFYEYALNGSPLDPADRGQKPFMLRRDGSLYYMYQQRNDDPLLNYSVEVSSNLTSGIWMDANTTAVGTNRFVTGEFDLVTNQIPTSVDHQYIRLRVETE